jgi:transcriptional regulator with XRE-family HTH domain
MVSGAKERTAEARMGAMIRKIRKASGMSQSALSEKIGVSYQQVQKYEKGSSGITVTRLRQIAAALDVPIDVFLGEDEGRAHYDPEEAKVVATFRGIKADKFRRAAMDMLGIIERLNNNVY